METHYLISSPLYLNFQSCGSCILRSWLVDLNKDGIGVKFVHIDQQNNVVGVSNIDSNKGQTIFNFSYVFFFCLLETITHYSTWERIWSCIVLHSKNMIPLLPMVSIASYLDSSNVSNSKSLLVNILTNEKSLDFWDLVVGNKYFIGIKKKPPYTN